MTTAHATPPAILTISCRRREHRIQLDPDRITLLDHQDSSGDHLRTLLGHPQADCYRVLTRLSGHPSYTWLRGRAHEAHDIAIAARWAQTVRALTAPIEDRARHHGLSLHPFFLVDAHASVARLAVGRSPSTPIYLYTRDAARWTLAEPTDRYTSLDTCIIYGGFVADATTVLCKVCFVRGDPRFATTSWDLPAHLASDSHRAHVLAAAQAVLRDLYPTDREATNGQIHRCQRVPREP
jgi:hypothetical protein